MDIPALKLISLNIEGDNHLDTVLAFLTEQNADVVCLQEVFQDDLELLTNTLGMQLASFVPLMNITMENPARLAPRGHWGMAVLTKIPATCTTHYYVGNADTLPTYDITNPNSNNRAIIVIETTKNDTPHRIIATHFTWSPKGEPTDLQRANMRDMLQLLSSYDNFILCGDFNAPRGGEIWQLMADNYEDMIPIEVTTTIDPELHKVKNLQYVVDGLFRTPGYSVKNVEVLSGVSDHKALVATVSPAE